VTGEDPDLAEAADYILAERRRLDEDLVWAVLNTLGEPPAPASDDLAVALVLRTHPGLRQRQVRVVLKEWRVYAGLAAEKDWEDLEE
jgi:hypothetical protein